MKSLLQPRLLCQYFLITWLFYALSVAANDSEALDSAKPGHHSGSLALERRKGKLVDCPLRDLLVDVGKEEGARLDLEGDQREESTHHPPVTSIERALGDKSWRMGTWNKESSMVLVVVIQKRALLLQIPFGIVNDAIVERNRRKFLDRDWYKSYIGDPLFGENGNITQFLKGPDKQNQYSKERDFEIPNWSSDAIQVLIRVRRNLQGHLTSGLAQEQIIDDLRKLLTKNGHLPTILPPTYQEVSNAGAYPGQFLLSKRLWQSDPVPQSLNARSANMGIVLSWNARSNVLSLWDGMWSLNEPIQIPLETQATGLYPVGAKPSTWDGELDGVLDFDKKGCTWAC